MDGGMNVPVTAQGPEGADLKATWLNQSECYNGKPCSGSILQTEFAHIAVCANPAVPYARLSPCYGDCSHTMPVRLIRPH
jgi:hypothetical protein